MVTSSEYCEWSRVTDQMTQLEYLTINTDLACSCFIVSSGDSITNIFVRFDTSKSLN